MNKFATSHKMEEMLSNGFLGICTVKCVETNDGSEKWYIYATEKNSTSTYQLREARYAKPRIFPHAGSALASARKIGFDHCIVQYIDQREKQMEAFCC